MNDSRRVFNILFRACCLVSLDSIFPNCELQLPQISLFRYLSLTIALFRLQAITYTMQVGCYCGGLFLEATQCLVYVRYDRLGSFVREIFRASQLESSAAPCHSCLLFIISTYRTTSAIHYTTRNVHTLCLPPSCGSPVLKDKVLAGQYCQILLQHDRYWIIRFAPALHVLDYWICSGMPDIADLF